MDSNQASLWAQTAAPLREREQMPDFVFLLREVGSQTPNPPSLEAFECRCRILVAKAGFEPATSCLHNGRPTIWAILLVGTDD